MRVPWSSFSTWATVTAPLTTTTARRFKTIKTINSRVRTAFSCSRCAESTEKRAAREKCSSGQQRMLCQGVFERVVICNVTAPAALVSV